MTLIWCDEECVLRLRVTPCVADECVSRLSQRRRGVYFRLACSCYVSRQSDVTVGDVTDSFSCGLYPRAVGLSAKTMVVNKTHQLQRFIGHSGKLGGHFESLGSHSPNETPYSDIMVSTTTLFSVLAPSPATNRFIHCQPVQTSTQPTVL